MGDLVLFVYNKEFKQYTAYLPFKRSLYLLHSDSHVDLSLSVPEHDGKSSCAVELFRTFFLWDRFILSMHLSSFIMFLLFLGALVDVKSWVVAEIVGKEYVLTKKVLDWLIAYFYPCF